MATATVYVYKTFINRGLASRETNGRRPWDKQVLSAELPYITACVKKLPIS